MWPPGAWRGRRACGKVREEANHSRIRPRRLLRIALLVTARALRPRRLHEGPVGDGVVLMDGHDGL